MRKIKIISSKILWGLTNISPKLRDIVITIVGYENYCKLLIYANMK